MNLVEEGIDVAVRIGHLPDSSLVAVSVGKVRRVVCASQNTCNAAGIPYAGRHPGARVRQALVSPRGPIGTSGPDAVPSPSRSTPRSPPTRHKQQLDACVNGRGLGMFLSIKPRRTRKQRSFVMSSRSAKPNRCPYASHVSAVQTRQRKGACVCGRVREQASTGSVRLIFVPMNRLVQSVIATWSCSRRSRRGAIANFGLQHQSSFEEAGGS